jgi:hypothetical protein
MDKHKAVERSPIDPSWYQPGRIFYQSTGVYLLDTKTTSQQKFSKVFSAVVINIERIKRNAFRLMFHRYNKQRVKEKDWKEL